MLGAVGIMIGDKQKERQKIHKNNGKKSIEIMATLA